jgi:hypothetical protein
MREMWQEEESYNIHFVYAKILGPINICWGLNHTGAGSSIMGRDILKAPNGTRARNGCNTGESAGYGGAGAESCPQNQ